jgi:hypothetical protein
MKTFLLTAVAALCCAMLMLTSCTDSSDNPVKPDEPTGLADVTILFYGHGGGNLDENVVDNLKQLYQAAPASYKKVNVAVEYKFSTAENLSDTYNFPKAFSDAYKDFGSQTLRFVVNPELGWTAQSSDSQSLYGEPNCRISCPDSLTNFINWAAVRCPAKAYVLVVNDHGLAYMPDSELPEPTALTRGVIFDDGHDSESFTAKSFCRAVANARIRPAAIYFDASEMNNLETLFEVRHLCDYIMASTYDVDYTGGFYHALIDCLAASPANMEQALTNYVATTVANWDYDDADWPNYADLCVTRTAGLDALGEALRAFTDRLCDIYRNGTDEQRRIIDQCTAEAVKVDSYDPIYDAAKYVASFAHKLPDVFDLPFYEQLLDTWNHCIVARNYSSYLTRRHYQVNHSVMLATEGTYVRYYWDDYYDTENGQWSSVLIRSKHYHADGTFDDYLSSNLVFPVAPDWEETLSWEWFATGDWGSTLSATYCQSAFDRIVGWSRWLSLNRQQPPIRSNADFAIPLSEDD